MRHRVCPWWLGFLLMNPLRRFLCDPEKLLMPDVKEGMTVLDIGCGMGFFSLPIARLVGQAGKVLCVDLQEKMIKGLRKRAQKAGLSGNIEARVCRKNSLTLEDLDGQIEFVLAFAVVHEVPDKERLFSEIHRSMKQGGRLLIAEPAGHVSREEFAKTVSLAQLSGFEEIPGPMIKRSRVILFQKR
jgi:ubiquinone/menaquinone biosynthesis C-methylase UbiE